MNWVLMVRIKKLKNFARRAESKKWPKPVADHFNKELDKLLRINPMAAEYPVAMNYVEFMLDLPWGEYTIDDFDLKACKKNIGSRSFWTDESKTRILEYLAVFKLKNDMKGPILCLYGPPGVGKTSLGRSIAKGAATEICSYVVGWRT